MWKGVQTQERMGQEECARPRPQGPCHAKELGFKSYKERESKDEVRGICAGGDWTEERILLLFFPLFLFHNPSLPLL